MYLKWVLYILQVLILKSATTYPCKDYIVAYIPVDLAYVSPLQFEVIPVPFYGNVIFYDPWRLQDIWSSHPMTTGPLSFGGQVKAKGTVSIVRGFGGQGYGQSTSYSAPQTPVVVTPKPVLETSLAATALLPTEFTLPEVILPVVDTVPIVDIVPFEDVVPLEDIVPFEDVVPFEDIIPCLDILPSIDIVPETPIPVAVETISITPIIAETNVFESGNVALVRETDVVSTIVGEASVPVASSIKFNGKVPVSGRIKICTKFC